VLQEQNLFGLLGHVAYLVVVHVVAADGFLYALEFILLPGDDLTGVSILQLTLERGTFEDLHEFLQQSDLLFYRTHVALADLDVLFNVTLFLRDVNCELDIAFVEGTVVDLQVGLVTFLFKVRDLLLQTVNVLPVDVLGS